MKLIGESQELKGKAGIYCIKCLANDKYYIGSAVSLGKRIKAHRNLLIGDKHHSPHLQRAWNKLGIKNFVVQILEFVDDVNKLVEREQYYIDNYLSYDDRFGYNISPTAGSNLGVKMSDEARMKMSEHSYWKTGTPEFVEEMRKKTSKRFKNKSPINKGIPISEETREKLRIANLGKKHTEQEKQKISIANKGRPKTEEEKRKISEAKRAAKLGGEKAINAKLTNEQANEIRKRFSQMCSCGDLAKEYNLDTQIIRNIIKNKTYTSSDYTPPEKVARRSENLNEDVVRAIRKDFANKVTNGELAKKYSVERHTVTRIITGKTWSWVKDE